jgi:hypothetical protein
MSAPLGLVAKLTSEHSLARRPLSLPEVVEGYKRLLRDLVSERSRVAESGSPGCVMIGIDELDKIENVDKAKVFLNDVKALFGVDGCFYLISISENAMSSFQLRGLPFRDAFDSALDDVLHVGALSLAGSIQLVNRRVYGLPQPFLMLCHCLSGGLPRDLIRMCRRLLKELAEERGRGETVAMATGRIVKDDVAERVRAAKLVLSAYHDNTLAGDLVAELSSVEDAIRKADLCVEALIEALSDASDKLSALKAKRDRGSDVSSGGEDVANETSINQFAARSGEELRAYFEFAAATLELFGRATNATKLTEAAKPMGLAEQLARARQSFSEGSQMALSRIDAVRSEIPNFT